MMVRELQQFLLLVSRDLLLFLADENEMKWLDESEILRDDKLLWIPPELAML